MPTHESDYDGANLYYNPQGIYDISAALWYLTNLISDSLENIQNIWSGLELGWAGDTANEAQDLQKHWNEVMVQLFGKKGKKGKEGTPGVLPAILGGLEEVSKAIESTEDGLATVFKKIGDAFPGPLDHSPDLSGAPRPHEISQRPPMPTPSSPPPSVDDLTTNPVTEKFPS
jgi:hypothetical protein